MTELFKMAAPDATLTKTAETTPTPAPQVAPQPPQAGAVFVPPGADLKLAPAMPVARPKAFYVTSYWHITPTDVDGVVDATNNSTNDKFTGTIADFNSMMRGN